jgi:FkbM family methyltransferase
MTVYVVGAHIGIHVLYIAKLLKGRGRIYAFEGWPENYSYLQHSLDINLQFDVDIVAVPKCVARESGTVIMAGGSSDGKNHIADTHDSEEERIQVQATSLDDFWLQTGDCPSLILMDIQGYELDALAGAERLIETCKPCLILEHHNNAAAILEWLAGHQYQVKNQDEQHIFTA